MIMPDLTGQIIVNFLVNGTELNNQGTFVTKLAG